MAVVTGDQTTILPVPDGQNQFPFVQHFPVNHIALNNKLIQLNNLINSLSNSLGLVQQNGVNGGPFSITYDWPGGVIVTDGDYVIILKAPYDFTLLSMDYTIGTGGGSFDVTLKNGGSGVGGSAVTVSDPAILTTNFSTNTAVSTGSRLEFVISNVSGAPTDSILNLNATRGSSIPTQVTDQIAITNDGVQLITNDGLNLVFQVIG